MQSSAWNRLRKRLRKRFRLAVNRSEPRYVNNAAVTNSEAEVKAQAHDLRDWLTSLAGVPTGLLFVRDPTGVSHSPEEFVEREDCHAGVAALARVVAELAG